MHLYCNLLALRKGGDHMLPETILPEESTFGGFESCIRRIILLLRTQTPLRSFSNLNKSLDQKSNFLQVYKDFQLVKEVRGYRRKLCFKTGCWFYDEIAGDKEL